MPDDKSKPHGGSVIRLEPSAFNPGGFLEELHDRAIQAPVLEPEAKQQCADLVAFNRSNIRWVLDNVGTPRLRAEQLAGVENTSEPAEIQGLDGESVNATLSIPHVRLREVGPDGIPPSPGFFVLDFDRPVMVGRHEVKGFLFHPWDPEAVEPIYAEYGDSVQSRLNELGIDMSVDGRHFAEPDMAKGDPTYTYAAYALGACVEELQRPQ